MGDTFAAMPRRPQETMDGLVYNMLNKAVLREVSRNKTPDPFFPPRKRMILHEDEGAAIVPRTYGLKRSGPKDS